MKRLVLVSLIWALSPCSVWAQPLDALFQNHMVFQRDAPIRIWGFGSPGDTVALTLADQRVEVPAEADGRWSATLEALPAGGPHELTVEAGAAMQRQTQTLTDILIGDVYLCSGQSNMEMSVVRALNSWAEVNSASNERIRMTKVPRRSTAAPQHSFPEPLTWESATPETVGDWSAVCYYFARELQKTVDVPLGLIDASWGGSDVRAWMDAESMAQVGGFEDTLELLHLYAEDEPEAQRRFGAAWEAWWRETVADGATEPWLANSNEAGAVWKPAPRELGNWKAWGEPELETFDGMVWYRSVFELTPEQVAAQAEQDATLVLGGVDEVDQTWINGRVLGNTFGWGDVRRYEVPAEWLRAGENVVVANVFSAWDYGGLVGDTPRELRLADGTSVPLATWHYRKAADELGREPPRAPWESIAGRTTIYNAMVAPLHDLELRGALWYQGESNTAQGLDYVPLLESMIDGWRRQFRDDLPFLVVQLAGFGPRNTAPSESGLADVREAQRLVAVNDPLTALATAVDVGDVYDIHPPNKQEVGRRLARAARHLIYGENVTPSGPQPRRVVRGGDAGNGIVRVEFEDVVGGLVAYGHGHPVGFQLCGAEPETCRYAEARIDGDAAVLDEVGNATRVRYCWADSPVCTLYDEAELPAIPFEWAIDPP